MNFRDPGSLVLYEIHFNNSFAKQLYLAGITGTVSIDENGDRNADYSLLDLNPNTNKFEVCSTQLNTTR